MFGSSGPEPSRDDRHIRLAKRLGLDEHAVRTKFLKSTVLLTGDRELLSRPEGRLMAITAMNLICRFCPCVDIFMPCANALATELASFGAAIDSSQHAKYRILDNVGQASEYQAVLSIGATPLSLVNTTEITASGWLAGVSSTEPAPALPQGWCGPGVLAAAALGASQVFIRLLDPPKGAAKLSSPMVFSTYDLTARTAWAGSFEDAGPELRSVQLPSILLGGCGAVGQAFVYCLLNLPIQDSTLWAVDHDQISLSNMNRSMLAFDRHVHSEVPPMKVALVEEAARGTNMRVHADSRPLSEALSERHLYPVGYPTVVVCGVDNGEARRHLQRLWPDLFLEGSTGDGQLQVLRWRYGSDRGCSFCYHSDVPTVTVPYHERMATRSGLSAQRISGSLLNSHTVVTDTDILSAPSEKRTFLAERKGQPICSVLSEIERFSQSQDTPPEPSVSFTSFMTGVILTAEVLKYAANLPQQLDSQFMVDTLFPMSQAEVVQLVPVPTCYCQKRKSSIDRFRKVVTAERPEQSGVPAARDPE